MAKQRCRHDITADILEAVSIGKNKLSHIALYSRLPIDRARILVEDMVRAGMLYYDSEKRQYMLTPRAYEWLYMYRSLERIYSPPATTQRLEKKR